MMRVLVVGSLPEGPSSDALDELYRQSCQEIGEALARRKWSVSVGTDKEDSADRLVVDGVQASQGPTDVYVYYHDKEPIPFDPSHAHQFGADAGAKFIHRHGPGNWVSGRIQEVRDADLLILLGGGDKTAQAFHTASVLPKACLPVPGFGGASGELWGTFVASLSHLPLNTEALHSAVQPWRTRDSAEAILEFAERYVAARPYANRNRSYLAFVVCFVIASVAGWGYLFFGSPAWTGVSLFLVMLAASVMGTALHWFVLLIGRQAAQVSPAFSWARAGAAIIEAFGLFVLLLVGSLAINGDVGLLDDLSNRATYLRLATIGSMFGLAAGFLTESIASLLAQRLSKGVRSVLTSPNDVSE